MPGSQYTLNKYLFDGPVLVLNSFPILYVILGQIHNNSEL